MAKSLVEAHRHARGLNPTLRLCALVNGDILEQN